VGAAGWLKEQRPEDSGDAGEVERELLELRDCPRSQAAGHRLGRPADRAGPARPVALPDAGVLEFAHERWADARDLPPSELLTVAAICRDAIAVLDTIGWLAGEHDATPAHVPITAVTSLNCGGCEMTSRCRSSPTSKLATT
jgi:hypothetical protein